MDICTTITKIDHQPIPLGNLDRNCRLFPYGLYHPYDDVKNFKAYHKFLKKTWSEWESSQSDHDDSEPPKPCYNLDKVIREGIDTIYVYIEYPHQNVVVYECKTDKQITYAMLLYVYTYVYQDVAKHLGDEIDGLYSGFYRLSYNQDKTALMCELEWES